MRSHSKRPNGVIKAEIARARGVIVTTQNPLAMSKEQSQSHASISSRRSLIKGMGYTMRTVRRFTSR